MGDLPQSRYTQGRAFLNVRVDFAGPFFIKESQRRKAALGKAYICLFICFCTKVVHIEVVSQLSEDAFMACFDRFVARRGLSSKVFSDNATNFVGASSRLRELYKWWTSIEIIDKLKGYFTLKEIEWHFIPPLAPHFGGLWEAGIKSCKYHLVRIVGNQQTTFEELATIVTRIEAVLNSRPLYPISSEPEDYQVLTPGHFLIGASLVAPPEQDLLDIPRNRLSRWQHLQRCMSDFWNWWRLDYLNWLQQRVKWTKLHTSIVPGTLVLLRDPNVPPLQWPTARVLEAYPGKDGVVRFADFIQRQAVKLQSEALLTNTAPEPLQTKTGYSKCSRQVLMTTDSPVNSTKCPACKKSHRIYDCPGFKTLTPQQRCDRIRGLNRCINCLASGHFSNQCSSRVSCRHCGRRHHSLLHFFSKESRKSESPHQNVIPSRSRIAPITAPNSFNDSTTAPTSSNPSGATSKISDSNHSQNAILSMSAMGQINVLLGTAVARIRNHRGRWHDLRILIDSGSQRSFITPECAHRLNLPLTRNRHRLVGFNNQVIPNVSFEAPCVIAPRQVCKPELNITAIVIERICEDMPTSPIPKDIVDKFRTLDLADPHFQHSRSVDFLLGADMFADILRVGNLESGQGEPRALETIFGWILMGPINANSPDEDPHPSTILHSTISPCSQCDELSRVLTKFWETEQVVCDTKSDPLDAQCEEHFLSTHSRDEAGRFTVKLPFNGSPPVLSDFKYRALNRFKNWERKFEKDSTLNIEYSKVIQEYWDKRYISRAISLGKCYLPHHIVLKDSSTNSFRSQLFAMSKGVYHHSLTGPTLQCHNRSFFFYIFYRFRTTDTLTEYKSSKSSHLSSGREVKSLGSINRFVNPVGLVRVGGRLCLTPLLFL
ncbi:uncharacterized protein, partial [Halyomorpha halys]|uniref:uncharacterized protein n=1 Tax=Halyomorpha halys TaxID=286706 RepID=UPI0034D2BD06